MNVVANGRRRPADEGWTVADFIIAQGLDEKHVVVELNGEPLERKRFGEVKLADGDRIELVRAVAGG